MRIALRIGDGDWNCGFRISDCYLGMGIGIGSRIGIAFGDGVWALRIWRGWWELDCGIKGIASTNPRLHYLHPKSLATLVEFSGSFATRSLIAPIVY